MNKSVRYKLIFKNYELGIVTELSKEWPRPSGIIILNEELKYLNEETKLIFDYFDYSIKSSKLLESSPYEEYKKFTSENELKYSNLIESKGWSLIDMLGNRNHIQIPILSDNNEIIWTAFEV